MAFRGGPTATATATTTTTSGSSTTTAAFITPRHVAVMPTIVANGHTNGGGGGGGTIVSASPSHSSSTHPGAQGDTIAAVSSDGDTRSGDGGSSRNLYLHGAVKPSASRLHARNAFRAARARVQFDLPAIQTKKRSDFVFLPRGQFKPWWDLLVVFLVIYSAFSLPVILCFDLNNPRINSWDIFVDVIFYLDVIFYFFTAYDENGVTVYSHKKIAVQYVRGWFAIDLIACLPWEQMAGAVTGQTAGGGVLVSVLRGCKALRLLRLSRLFKFLESHAMISHAMRMVRMLFFFFLFAHWFACLWFAIGAYGSRHSHGLDGWLSALSPPLDPDLHSFKELYVTALYWVFTTWVTIGYGDVLPKTDLEKCFAMGTMVAGAVIYATIFGNVAILLQSLGRLDTIFKDKMENVNSYMVDLQLPTTLQLRIRNYYTFLWARHKSFSSGNQLEELPASLTNQIAHFLHRDTIEKCSIFKDAEEPFLRAVTTKLKFCVSLPGDYVFKEDDAGDKIYFLRKGRIEIESVELGTLAILEEGAFFGDIALLLPLPGGGGGGGGGQDAMTGSPPMLPGHGTSGGSGGSISGLSSSSSSSSLLTSSSGGLAVLGTEPAHLRRKRTASAKSVVSSDMYYLMREEFIAILLAYPSYAALFTEISRSRLKQTKLHSDEVLVEKILESWAKKGWLKLRGLKRQPEKAPGGGPIGGGAGGGGGPGMMRPRRAITPSSVLQVMASQRNRAAGASTPVGGSAMPGRKDFGGGIEMTSIGSGANQEGALSSTLTSSSGKPPVRLGMKGMMVLAAVAEHKRSLVAGTIPPKPAPEPAPASSSSAAALPAPAPAPVNLTVDVPTWSRQGAIEVDIRPDTPVQEHQSAGETIAKVAMDG